MFEDLKPFDLYTSQSGIVLRIRELSQHAQDCSINMVTYENVTETFDYSVSKLWTVEESIFRKRNTKMCTTFSTPKNGKWNTHYPPTGVWLIIRFKDLDKNGNPVGEFIYEKAIRPMTYVKWDGDDRGFVCYCLSGREYKGSPEWQYA